jgi:hypothetical protein
METILVTEINVSVMYEVTGCECYGKSEEGSVLTKWPFS